ncbi:hypothetical protein KIF53_04220 [Chromobacterium subtsugae]|uniref:Uncharacterized protein n=1 Tax=Chromobacterium subtsugae TaxID=251747 RepID=A0ABS7F9R1_9NEIS|nr:MULTISPECIES: hypothetical protein [Chromobacterium]KUM05504.1 hypothetical protein Cv017_08845 [Chromobacterium subtsugae]KZE87834.1 hypothetical protein AWB61_08475 [Chromobacterium sp. F49]MBW7565322.1 hypothetical protein [Chromobacterium subtsugae]MBW8286827.1 hypothetical protein [Chromobacterium subtsugae]WSE90698.1 hypothetical protein U6115_17640 [Chromobacterium subtsugae]
MWWPFLLLGLIYCAVGLLPREALPGPKRFSSRIRAPETGFSRIEASSRGACLCFAIVGVLMPAAVLLLAPSQSEESRPFVLYLVMPMAMLFALPPACLAGWLFTRVIRKVIAGSGYERARAVAPRTGCLCGLLAILACGGFLFCIGGGQSDMIVIMLILFSVAGLPGGALSGLLCRKLLTF